MSAPFTPFDPITRLIPPEQMLFLGRPFTVSQAADAGISRHALDRLARDGLVRRVLKGVYVDSASCDCLDLRTESLSLVLPTGAVVCDRTAAWLHGADLLGKEAANGEVPPVDVLRLRGGTRVRHATCKGSTRTLDTEQDLCELNGIVCTTPLRTALDLGRQRSRYDSLAALDALLRVGDFSIADIQAELPRLKGHRWVTRLRELAPLADRRAESPAESRTRLLLLDAGLPLPELQWVVTNEAGAAVYRLDLAYPHLLLAIEYDGVDFHTSPEQREHDLKRRQYLRQLGWTIVVLTAADVYTSHPCAADKVRRSYESLSARHVA